MKVNIGLLIDIGYYADNKDNEINIDTLNPEFKNWLWMNPIELSSKAIYFKKHVYKKINELFLPIIKEYIN